MQSYLNYYNATSYPVAASLSPAPSFKKILIKLNKIILFIFRNVNNSYFHKTRLAQNLHLVN